MNNFLKIFEPQKQFTFPQVQVVTGLAMLVFDKPVLAFLDLILDE